MSERSAKKFRFNIIDVLFILLILIVILGGFYFFRIRSAKNAQTAQQISISYTVEIKDIDEDDLPHITKGDPVVDSYSLKNIGIVEAISYTDSEYIGVNQEDGTIVKSVYPGYQNIKITIQADADTGHGTYEINGYTLAVGTAVSVRLPGFAGSGSCISITEGEV